MLLEQNKEAAELAVRFYWRKKGGWLYNGGSTKKKREQEHSRALEDESERDFIRPQLGRAVNETKRALRDAKADSDNSRHRCRLDEVLSR